MKTLIKKIAAAVLLLTSSLWGQSTAIDAGHQASGVLPVLHGGTGTPTPGLIPGTNITISGSWPNQTINSSGGGGGSITLNTISPLLGGTTGSTQTITFAASLLTAAYGGNGNGTSDNSAAFTADCAANGQVYLPLGAFALTSNYTIPCPVFFGAGASIVAPNAVTVTMNYCPVAPPITIFTLSGTGKIQFAAGACGMGRGPYPEWWGATGNSGTPTDQVRISACFASLDPAAVVGGPCQLQAKFYYINAPITLATNATTLWGQGRNSTVISTNSATADTITITGLHAKVQHMTLLRSVAGSAGATGINVNANIAAAYLDDLQIQDNPYGILLQNTPGGTIINNSLITYTAISSTAVAQYCVNANGAMNSTQLTDVSCNNLTSSASLHVWGLWEHGANINDLWTYNFGCTQTDHCHYVDGSGSSTNFGSDDIHFINTIADQQYLSALYVTGLSSANSAALDVDGGYFLTYNSNSVPDIDIENSNGVSLRGVSTPNGITSLKGILINGGGGNSVTASTIRTSSGGGSYGLTLNNTVNNSITGNIFWPVTSAPGMVLTSGASHNTITGNNFKGTSSGTGISTDSTSNFNKFTANDLFAFTTSYTDAGTGNLWNGLPKYAALTDGATITWALITGAVTNNATVTLAGNRTLAITGATTGASGTLWVKQDATGTRTLALPSGSIVINGGGGACTLTTTANAIDILTWTYNGTNYAWTCGLNFN